MESIKQFLNKSIDYLALVAMSLIFVSIITVSLYTQNYGLMSMNIICIGVSYLIWQKLKINCQSITKRKMDLFFIIGLVIYNIVVVFFIKYFQMHPGWDFGWVYNMAYETASGKQLVSQHHAYLYNYPFNYSLLMLYEFIFKNIYFNLHALFILGTACINITVIFIYLTLRNNYKTTTVCITSMILLLFYPYIAYTLIPYSDTVALPFFAMAIYFIYKDQKINHSIVSIVLLSIAVAIGGVFKILLLIILIAYTIYGLIEFKLKTKILLIIPFVVFIGVNQVFGDMVDKKHYSYAKFEDSGMTPLYWMYAGLNYDAKGRYNNEDYDESLQWGIRLDQAGKQEVTDFYIDGIVERVTELGPIKLLELAQYKLEATWGDGTYGMSEYILINPLKNGETRIFFTEGFGKYLIDGYSQFIHLFILVGVWLNFKSNGSINRVLKLIFLGFFTYLILFEAGPRYILLLSPVLFIICAKQIDESIVK